MRQTLSLIIWKEYIAKVELCRALIRTSKQKFQIEPDINGDVIPTPSSTKIDSYGNDLIEIAPGINLDNIQAGPSTKKKEKEHFNNENTAKPKPNKSIRMTAITKTGFNSPLSAFNGTSQFHFKKNIENVREYKEFLDLFKPEMYEILSNAVQKSDDMNSLLELDLVKILGEIEEMSKGIGYWLNRIDGILMNINNYTPLKGSSFIPLPTYVENKKATINVKNDDEKCFKYSLLAKYVNRTNDTKVEQNYACVKDRYNFSMMAYPVSFEDVHKFEKENPGVSINVYINPLKVCDEGKYDHHDLLLSGDRKSKTYYCRITNLGKFVGARMSRHGHSVVLCKRCFKCYSKSKSPFTAEHRLREHTIYCNKNKPLAPILPAPKTFVKFENWGATNKHTFVIYVDFEYLLEKELDAQQNNNTKIIHHHEVMNFCYYIKTSDDVSSELLEQHNIENGPVVFRGNSSMDKGEIVANLWTKLLKSPK
ncbi:Hypothetical protein CINCED_3A018048 [Cinara cedri]|uniref:C2H2-type domain-containing protein n=1 Tax=Cinara cedri TaxID=506608 RepID=A0A5E4N4C6_9HEMI|nr:Hypothetical protein CINCED_3A018048 [Cinara cedri]